MNQSGWRKHNKALSLHKELKTTKEEIQRYSLPQESAYQLIFQNQIISPEEKRS